MNENDKIKGAADADAMTQAVRRLERQASFEVVLGSHPASRLDALAEVSQLLAEAGDKLAELASKWGSEA